MRRVEEAVRIAQGDDAGTRRHEIGLGLEIDRRRAAGAERRDRVVGARDGSLRVLRADGQHPRRVGRCGDAAVLLRARRVPAQVPRGSDHHDAGIDSMLGGKCEWIRAIRLGHRGGDGEIDDSDIELAAVAGRVFQGRDDVADDAAAGGV
jgi:hypothetical protein